MSEALPLRQVVEGDCLNVLKTFPDDSIDLIACDPPYQLSPVDNWRHGMTKQASKGFMGKTWDVLPSVEIWRECLRVLKHGAFAFILCTPRLDSLTEECRRLQDAGFIISFSPILWAYGSGFPKALNISKIVDKKLGFERETIPPTGGLGGGSGNTVGSFTGHCVDSKPISEEAKRLDGSYAGFQPKPAVEVVIVAMKPLECKTYVEQALKNGKGITWLDGGRIPYDYNYTPHKRGTDNSSTPERMWGYTDDDAIIGNEKGRFAPNLLVSDDVLNDGTVSKSRETSSEGGFGVAKNTFGINNPEATVDYGRGFNDEGSFSRYFDLDRWFEERIKRLPKNVRKTFPFLIVPKAAPNERQDGLDNDDLPKKPVGEAVLQYHEGRRRDDPPVSNFHPTCKPIKLMSYLVTIGSREGDIVLDPFLGSGTTAVACELLSRRWIGVELDKEYAAIARARVKQYLSQARVEDFFG